MTDHVDESAHTAEAAETAETAEAAEAGETSGAQAPPDENITTPPDGSPPWVAIRLPATPVLAGVPTQYRVDVDRGVSFIPRAGGGWTQVPAVNYTELDIAVQGVVETHDHRSSVNSGGTYTFTISSPGSYQVTAAGKTSANTTVNANAATVTVVNPDPPSFTWNSPANGAVIGIGPNGGPLTVDISTPATLAYPLTVRVTVDGATSSDQSTGTRFSKSVTLAQTSIGPRTVTVTIVDAQNRTASQSRTIITQDGAPPTVSLDAFPNPLVVQQLPAVLLLTGRTSGAASGVNLVTYSVPALNTSGQATNTGPNGDWSSWSAAIPFATTGDDIAFTVTATDTRGGTGSASSKITITF
ncbi:hypothetical protein [Actinomadura fibrosa]|uniref:Uncharacterized protein n=1 Tax=Actinomadura fibrosa TaxID=111802 RepID=A0ABW2XP63_9ACTN|nr:hypothetical protein [Actinomadura fibrosa]